MTPDPANRDAVAISLFRPLAIREGTRSLGDRDRDGARRNQVLAIHLAARGHRPRPIGSPFSTGSPSAPTEPRCSPRTHPAAPAGRSTRITVPVLEADSNHCGEVIASTDVRDLMAAIAAVPETDRNTVVAVEVVGLSYRQAARQPRTREARLASRLSPGRQHVARALGESAGASKSAGQLQMPIGVSVPRRRIGVFS